MYVIFPAEDLICMTYGVAVPRFKPRPSLDVLREPLIPFDTPSGTRPSSGTTTAKAIASRPIREHHQLAAEPFFVTQQGYSPDAANIATDRHVLGTPILNPQSNPVVHVPSTPLSHPIQDPQIQPQSQPSPSRPPTRRPSLLRVPSNQSAGAPAQSASKRGGGASKKEKKRRDLTPLRNATVTYEQLNAEEEPYDEPYSDTDPLNNDDSDPYFERERSPSEFFETAVSYPVLLPPSHSQANANDKNSKNGNKKKSRLQLSLGRLGRQQSLNETIRVRDELSYRVANPTFTRENLWQQNYDAFFESGEPVYSIEKRNLETPDSSLDIAPESPYSHQSANMSSPSPSGYYSAGPRHSQNFFQLGLAGPSSSATGRPKTVTYMPPMSGGVRGCSPAASAMLSPRAQSVELDSRRSTGSRRGDAGSRGGGGVTPKGDRCLSFNGFRLCGSLRVISLVDN